jgi:hypothetical protein
LRVLYLLRLFTNHVISRQLSSLDENLAAGDT